MSTAAEFSSGDRQRRLLKRFLLILALMMNLRTFQYFPGMRVVQDGWIFLCLPIFLILYPAFKILRDWTFSHFELYLIAMMVVLLLLPAISAFREFGQPLYYGVLAQRAVILIGSSLLFLCFWRDGWIDAEDVKWSLVVLVWTTFFIFWAMRVTLNPTNYSATPGFVTGSGNEYAFTVPGIFMPFGTLYYAFLGLRNRRMLHYIYATILFETSLGPSGRALSVSLALTILYFASRWRRGEQLLLVVTRFLIVITLVVGALAIFNPTFVSLKISKYTDAFRVIAGLGPGEDVSANARVLETAIALPYVRDHPLFGVGFLSVQWNGGNDAVIGSYFFQDDIGLVGVLFSYGIFGLLLCAFQFPCALMASLRVEEDINNPLFDATKGFVIYSALSSITTGVFVFSFQITSFFVLLLILLSDDAVVSLAGTQFSEENRTVLPPFNSDLIKVHFRASGTGVRVR